ncbi:MAG: 30S ribosome-binding factor RbfA [Steroidobacteraceae bacterium]|nr:30S ribosome-binding factor RbfA [Steroidobacteraceae bacterium]
MAGSARRERIEGEIQRVLSQLAARGIKDPRVGSVTITAVQLAPDLSVARVFFLPFAGRQDADEVRAGLASAAGFLRGEVGRRLSLRHAPRLEFVVDRHLEQASELSALIDRAVGEDRSRAAGAEGAADAPGAAGTTGGGHEPPAT